VSGLGNEQLWAGRRRMQLPGASSLAWIVAGLAFGGLSILTVLGSYAGVVEDLTCQTSFWTAPLRLDFSA
jgi:hypothetical protein